MTKKISSNSQKYIVDREKYLNSIGIFRCLDTDKGKPKCKEHCKKCKSYYYED